MKIIVVIALCLLVATEGKPQQDKRFLVTDIKHFTDQLTGALTGIAKTIGTTFSQVAQVAAQQGTDLIHQALQQGAQVAANGTQTFLTQLQTPGQARKRFLKAEFNSFLDKLKGTFTQLGQTFGETFKQVGEVAAQQGTQLLQQALQQGAQLALNGTQAFVTNLQTPGQARKRLLIKDAALDFIDHLKATFSALGQTFSETFKQLGEVTAQQGTQLLQQALQQGAQVAMNGTQTLLTNLQKPGTSKRFLKDDIQHFLGQLSSTFTSLGQTFGETFKQVGEVAGQQGTQLLQQALQQGAQLALNGTQTFLTHLQQPQ